MALEILDNAKFILDNLNEIGAFLKKDLQDELAAQGHNDTGALSKSIDYVVETYQNGLRLLVSYNDYGAVVNNGIRPNRIPFGAGGGGKSAYISALVGWVKRRIENDDKKALGIAFAIAKTHKKEGLPTRGSFAFSSNGRRKNFQDFVLRQSSAQIAATLQQGVSIQLLATLDNILINFQKLL